jgi:hypothetical protein
MCLLKYLLWIGEVPLTNVVCGNTILSAKGQIDILLGERGVKQFFSLGRVYIFQMYFLNIGHGGG